MVLQWLQKEKNIKKTEIDGAPGIKQDHIEKFFILVLTVVFLIWR